MICLHLSLKLTVSRNGCFLCSVFVFQNVTVDGYYLEEKKRYRSLPSPAVPYYM